MTAKYDDPWTWVGLAASDDDPTRFTLNGIFVQRLHMIATNGQRLHRVEFAHDVPQWQGVGGVRTKDGERLPAGRFPEWRKSIPDLAKTPQRLAIDDDLIWLLAGMTAASRKWASLSRQPLHAAPFCVGIVCADDTTALVQPTFVLDALLGMRVHLEDDLPTMQCAGAKRPVMFRCNSGEEFGVRTAVLMPVIGLSEGACIVSLGQWIAF